MNLIELFNKYKKRRWFQGILVTIIIGIIGVFVPVSILMYQELTKENCSIENYEYCKNLFEEVIVIKTRLNEANGNQLNSTLEDKFGLSYEQIQTMTSNFKEIAKTDFDKGLAYFVCEDFDEAIYYFNRSKIVDPERADVWNNLGAAICRKADCSKESLEQSLFFYEKAIDLEPNNPHMLFNYGFALHKLERWNDSIEYFDKVLNLTPDDYEAWQHRGDSLAMLGEYEEAKISFNKSVQINPDYEIAWYYLGWLKIIVDRDCKGAAYYWDIVMSINPSSEVANKAEGMFHQYCQIVK